MWSAAAACCGTVQSAIRPHSSASMYEPIIAALRRGAADEALAAAHAAVAEQPQDPAAQRLLAMSQRLAGDADAAIATIDHAITLAPEDAELHLARAGM